MCIRQKRPRSLFIIYTLYKGKENGNIREICIRSVAENIIFKTESYISLQSNAFVCFTVTVTDINFLKYIHEIVSTKFFLSGIPFYNYMLSVHQGIEPD